MREVVRVPVLLVLLVLSGMPSGAALAQVPAAGTGVGSIVGVVRDTGGLPVVAVLVSASGTGAGRASARYVETDSLGRFRLAELAAGRWTLRASRLGYAPQQHALVVVAGEVVRQDFGLAPAAVEVAGVSVEAPRERQRFAADAGVTSRRLAGSDIKRIPGLAEADVMRTVQVLPGVITTSDFSSAFHVRGGAADENLILLDGFPIYNPFHLGGLFGVFNADMVSGAELLAGGFPASYGGRVSSVLNVESDPGRAGGGIDGAGGISLLASRLALGSDLSAGVAHALGLRSGRGRISARRSYFDEVLKPIADFPYHLTDVQGYFEGWTPGGGRLTLTGYTGGDVLDFTRPNESFPLRVRMDWGNDMVGARWSGGWGAGRLLDLRAGFTRFGAGIHFPDYADTRFTSSISQGLLRADVHVDAS
ncbi:MAG TPA: carboxypeptidase regulatory-like domain-containing protein, partial [Longimicrobiales bacterium]